IPPKTAVPYKKPCVAILIFASESGTIFPSKNACFERSTRHLQNLEIGPALTEELYLIQSSSFCIVYGVGVALRTINGGSSRPNLCLQRKWSTNFWKCI